MEQYPKQTYELWLSPDGTYSYFPSTNTSAQTLLEEDSQLLITFNVGNYEEAQQKMYEYMNWGEYKISM